MYVKKSFVAACKDVPGFSLVLKNNIMSLSKTYAYFYQVQTQMHGTHLAWCDFVVWSPFQDIFIERVCYDPIFMKAAVLKAKELYFEKFLPSVVPCMIISQESCEQECTSTIPLAPIMKIRVA